MSSIVICPGAVALRVAVAVPEEQARLATMTVLPAVNVPTHTVFIENDTAVAGAFCMMPNWYLVPARLVNLIALVTNAPAVAGVVTCGS
jgi:hypothetical protein